MAAWHVTYYTALFAIASAFALVTGLRIWQRRAAPGAIYLGLVMLAVAEWAGSAALESAAVGIPTKLFWAKAEYLGLGTSPVFLLTFAWAYHRRDNRLPLHLAAAAALPQAVVVLAAFTNEWHGLIWSSLTWASDEVNVLVYGHGPLFYVGVAYSYMGYLAAAIVLVHAVWRAESVYRGQVFVAILCLAPSWLAGTVYVVAPSLVGNVEVTPFGFVLTAFLLNWTLLRYRLFDLIPVAHDVLIQSMSDGLLVLDAQGRLVSVNPAAQRMLWSDGVSRIGVAASVALANRPSLEAWLRDPTEAQAQLRLDEGGPRWVDARVTELRDRRGQSTGRLVVLRDVSDLKLQEQKLAYLAGHDALTGLPNFRTLEGALDRAVAAARRGRPSALLYLDLDKFKAINDTLGHSVGNQALVHTVHLLCGRLRESDLLARVGGDEFAALLDGADLATGLEVAERLRQEVERCPFRSDGRSFPLSLSIGLAPVGGGLSGAAVLARADAAMYAAKSHSRNRVVVAGSADAPSLSVGCECPAQI